jgi:transposase-like protein
MPDRHERQVTGGFAARLRQLVDAYGSANSIAKAIDRSEGAVRKWLRAESEPNVTDVRALCEHTQTSVEWLVTGRGPRDLVRAHEASASADENAAGKLDHILLEAILEAVEVEIRRAGSELPPPKRSMLVVALYDLFRDSRAVDVDAVARLIRLAR